MSGIDGLGLPDGDLLTCARPGKTTGVERPQDGRVLCLTPTQRDLYLHALANPESAIFNIGVSVQLGPDVDSERWQQAVAWVARSDDIAGSCFITRRGEAFQYLAPDYPVYYTYTDLQNSETETAGPQQYLERQREQGFNLAEAPLLRNYLVRDRNGDYTAAIMMPHILLDGMAAKAYMERVGAVYETLLEDATPAPKLPPDFFAYATRDLPAFDTDELLSYWSARLRQVHPLDFSMPRAGPAEELHKSLILNPEDTTDIKRYCRQQGLNLPAFFMTLYALLLRRYANCEQDIAVLSIVSGRPRRYLRSLGCFYQVLPYLIPGEMNSKVFSLADSIKHVAHYRDDLGSLQHVSMTQLDRLLPAAGVKCFYNHQSYAVFKMLGERRPCKVYMRHPQGEVHLAVTESGSTIMLELYFDRNKFPDLRFLERLEQLARQAVQGCGRLDALDIMLAHESEQLSQAARLAATKRNLEPTVQQVFETQALQ